MGLFKRLAGLIGLGREEDKQEQEATAAGDTAEPSPLPSSAFFAAAAAAASDQHLPRKGFSVPVQVPVEKAAPPPLLVYCPAGDGGIQGLRWYSRRLRIDEDGDIADEFLCEISPDNSTSLEENNRPLPRFEVKYSTKPAKVKNLSLLPNGTIQHLVENEGNLEWI